MKKLSKQWLHKISYKDFIDNTMNIKPQPSLRIRNKEQSFLSFVKNTTMNGTLSIRDLMK